MLLVITLKINNLSVIHCIGRTIAVDWALSKDRYQKAVEHSGTCNRLTAIMILISQQHDIGIAPAA